MKRSHKKNTFTALILVSMTLCVFFFTNPDEKGIHPVQSIKVLTQKKQPEKAMVKKTLKREPAAIKQTPPDQKRVILGSYNKQHEITLLNQVDKEWIDKYQKTFFRMAQASEIKDFEIIKKRSIIKVKNNLGRHMEHVLVRYKKPNGHPFSFEAYIDSQTGQVVQSWNQTQFEFQKPHTFDPQDRGYRSP